ncbi:hypothetical protein BC830DRAFT_1088794 [Chytriomyces sp. MP71]|nr:hypothetical protein BC830DRAFT_1088794 [Chytriomyces sp. MP71]
MGDEDDEYWTCAGCEMENTQEDTECAGCGADKPASRLAGFKVAQVLKVEAIPRSQLKLITVTVNPNEMETGIPIVTNTKNIDVGERVVVALPGAIVKIDGEDVTIKKTSVGGKKSEGMLCDGPTLGWKGTNGIRVLLPNEFPIGSTPPDEKPR